MRNCKRFDSVQGNSFSKPFQRSLNCKKTAIFLDSYLKTESRAPWLTTLQPALKRWLTSVRRGKRMDKERSVRATESCLHRFGLITPVEERCMECILIDQRGHKKSTHQNREECLLDLFSLTLRLHSSGIISTVEEQRMFYIQHTLKKEKRGRTNKRDNNQRIRLPLSYFLDAVSFTEKSNSYQREGIHQEEIWHQSEK